MDEKRTEGQSRNKKPTRRRRRRRLGALSALLYVAFVIGISTFLATYGWQLANDVLALNKAEHSAVITLPDEIFEIYEVEEEVEVEVEGGEEGETTIEIQTRTVQDADMDYVAQKLQEGGIIEHDWLFRIFSFVTKSNLKLRPGTYTLSTSMDYRAVVANMGSSSTTRATVSVTFLEGSTVDQMFALLEEKGVASVEDLEEMAANYNYKFSFLQEIPLGDHHRLEGYLFPDTYDFYVNDDPKYVINKLLLNFDARFTDEMREQVAQTEYTIYDILTIASMVEKETDGTDEKTIASVIYNRLERPNNETQGKLQIDATLVYINGGNVPVEADKEIDSPYNTYMYKGLPAGPIANPGMAAIRAAMKPETTNYYYYVLNPETNRHEYSTNYNDHMNLVNQYAEN